MTRRALIFLVVGTLFILSGFGLVLKVLFFSESNGQAALQVNSFPEADVYIDDKKVGKAPYNDEKLSAGDYTIKLVANNSLGQTLTWVGKVKLTAETLTYVNRQLAADNDSSSGEVLSLDKLATDDTAELAVISTPDKAQVKVDGTEVGTAPVTIKKVTPGDHETAVSLPGYRDYFTRGKVLPGYRLNLAFQLAKIGQTPIAASPSAASNTASSSADTNRPYVVIKDTPTGWLRVRFAPSIDASESARVNPGEKHALLDQQTGWVKIKLTDKTSGWVSDGYVEIFK